MSSASNDNFPSSFPIWMPFLLIWLLWLGLLALGWVSMVIADIPVWFPILRGMPTECDVGYGFLLLAFIMLRYVPSISTLLRVFIINGCWILSNAFPYWYDHVVFALHFVYEMYHTYGLADVVPTLNPQDKSHLITVYDLFNVLLDLVS